MKALFKSIYDKFSAANDFKTAVSSRFYLNSAPQSVSMPYSVYQMISNSTDYNFTSTFDETEIQIDIIDVVTSSNILDVADKCMALFDDCTLSISGYEFHKMERQFNYLVEDIEAEIQRYVIQYMVLTRK